MRSSGGVFSPPLSQSPLPPRTPEACNCFVAVQRAAAAAAAPIAIGTMKKSIMAACCLAMISNSSFAHAFSLLLRRRIIPTTFCRRKGIAIGTPRYINNRYHTTATSLAFQTNGQIHTNNDQECDNLDQQQQLQHERKRESKFRITAPYPPTADQPQAIQSIVSRVEKGDKFSILRGCTG